jgi:hypothetical protein
MLKPAAWTNGTFSACEGAYVYALEVPGAPFEAGYSWGSKALSPAPAASTPSR